MTGNCIHHSGQGIMLRHVPPWIISDLFRGWCNLIFGKRLEFVFSNAVCCRLWFKIPTTMRHWKPRFYREIRCQEYFCVLTILAASLWVLSSYNVILGALLPTCRVSAKKNLKGKEYCTFSQAETFSDNLSVEASVFHFTFFISKFTENFQITYYKINDFRYFSGCTRQHVDKIKFNSTWKNIHVINLCKEYTLY